MAALSAGAYGSWAELAQVVQPARTILPNEQAHAIYQARKTLFTALYENTAALMHRCAEA